MCDCRSGYYLYFSQDTDYRNIVECLKIGNTNSSVYLLYGKNVYVDYSSCLQTFGMYILEDGDTRLCVTK